MKRRNNFEKIKIYLYEWGECPTWFDEEGMWGIEEELAELEPLEEKTISGHEWNKQVWENGGFDNNPLNKIVDEDCEKCGHLLVTNIEHPKNRFCSNFDCDYENEDFATRKAVEEERISRTLEPEPIFRVAGETLEEFCERTKLSLKNTTDKKGTMECVICGQYAKASDFFTTKRSGMAVVLFAHDNCDNVMAKATPFTERSKKSWGEVLGKIL